jgi:hypothetical protein
MAACKPAADEVAQPGFYYDAPATLRSRIKLDSTNGSNEAQQWRLEHLAQYLAARAWMLRAADLVV